MARSTALPPSVSVPLGEATTRLAALDFRKPVFFKKEAERFFLAYFYSHWPSPTSEGYREQTVIWLDSTFDFRGRLLDMDIYPNGPDTWNGPFSTRRIRLENFLREATLLNNEAIRRSAHNHRGVLPAGINQNDPQNLSNRYNRLLNSAVPEGSSFRRSDPVRFQDSNLLSAYEYGLGYFLLLPRHIILVSRPSIGTHQEGGQRDLVLHSLSGPAITFAADKAASQWWIRGIQVEQFVVEHPERITKAHIRAARNAEVRRTLIDQYGLLKYSQERGMREVDRADEFGCILYATPGNGIRRCVLEMVNSTPESDGTHRHVARRVPGRVRTAHEAVAWTFGLTREQYHPVVQT